MIQILSYFKFVTVTDFIVYMTYYRDLFSNYTHM